MLADRVYLGLGLVSASEGRVGRIMRSQFIGWVSKLADARKICCVLSSNALDT